MKVTTFAAILLLFAGVTFAEPARVTMFTHLDGSGSILGTGKRVYAGAIAMSPDLMQGHKLTYGMGIEIEGLGIFELQTQTARWIKNTIDIYIWDRKLARNWGTPCFRWRRVW